jgi:glycosyltransferase involved in cell wall biosynthesis
MAMARPVVATRVPGTREVVRDGDTGFLVDPADAEGFAGALERLLLDPALREAMGARGREVAIAEFDERPIAESLRTLYLSRLRRVAPGRLSPRTGGRRERFGRTSPARPGR